MQVKKEQKKTKNLFLNLLLEKRNIPGLDYRNKEEHDIYWVIWAQQTLKTSLYTPKKIFSDTMKQKYFRKVAKIEIARILQIKIKFCCYHRKENVPLLRG